MYYTINEDKAKQSKKMSSYMDYIEGSATKEYRNMVDEIAEYAESQKKKINNEESIKKINNLVDRFSKKYADWVNRYYEIQCYCPSILITGGSNFPTRRKEKQNSMMDRHFEEYNKLMKIKDKIHSIVQGSNIIKSSDKNAIQKLEEKILKKEELQKEMKAQNAYYRKHKTMRGYKNLSDMEAKHIDKEIQSSYSWAQKPCPSFSLTNNNQEIRRLKKRLEELKKAKEAPGRTIENEYFKTIENTEIMRLQLFFDDIPQKEIRTILKLNCFKWSPSNKCWQRQLTNNARYSLKRVIKQIEELKKATTMSEHDSSKATPNN